MTTPSEITSAPIADLSYRNYDGPLGSPTMRWWVIARQGIRLAMGRRSFWIYTLLASSYYVAMMVFLAIISRAAETNPQFTGFQRTLLARLVWKDQILHGFSTGQIMFLAIALLIGAGSIANDNRSNALLVYLSKPCSKLDYTLGKWVGTFVPLFVAMAVPSFLFYLYGALSFRTYGFIQDDPWLPLRMLAFLPLASALSTSLILAASSLFRQGRVAGATFAGVYFIGEFFTKFMQVAWITSGGETSNFAPLLRNLFYCSIDGVQIGLAKAILHTSGSPLFGFPSRTGTTPIPAPPLLPCLLVVFGLTFASCALIWSRVRAVEVVG